MGGVTREGRRRSQIFVCVCMCVCVCKSIFLTPSRSSLSS